MALLSFSVIPEDCINHVCWQERDKEMSFFPLHFEYARVCFPFISSRDLCLESKDMHFLEELETLFFSQSSEREKHQNNSEA